VSFRVVNPSELPAPRGFNHGMLAEAPGRVLFVAGQTAAGPDGRATGDFAAQFAVALDRVLAVVAAAGGSPGHVGRVTVYVTELAAYRNSRPALADAWRRRFGRHYPAMALLEVKGLVDEGATCEIEADAVLP
jgi:enamine deaminase RidA (YjgF/YER057c/UK114 family)